MAKGKTKISDAQLIELKQLAGSVSRIQQILNQSRQAAQTHQQETQSITERRKAQQAKLDATAERMVGELKRCQQAAKTLSDRGPAPVSTVVKDPPESPPLDPDADKADNPSSES